MRETLDRSDGWKPTVGVKLSRDEGRSEVRRWRWGNPSDEFRLRKYEPAILAANARKLILDMLTTVPSGNSIRVNYRAEALADEDERKRDERAFEADVAAGRATEGGK